jgi:hypothetical protein
MPTKLSQLDAYASPWLKAADLQGRAHRLTVKSATVEEVRQQDGSKELKIIVTFNGAKKRLIANKTQAMTLADAAHTEEFGRWAGVAVILEPGRTRNGQDTINIRCFPATQGNGAAPTQSSKPATQGDQGDQVEPPKPATVRDNPFDDDADPHGLPGPRGLTATLYDRPGFAG